MLHASRWKCRTQKIAKKSPSGHHRTTLSSISSQLRHVSAIRKKWLNSNVSPNMSSQHEASLQISTCFMSWQRYSTAVKYWASAKLLFSDFIVIHLLTSLNALPCAQLPIKIIHTLSSRPYAGQTFLSRYLRTL